MKKILVIIGLLISSLAAHADPLEALSAAFKAAQEQNADKVQATAAGETVLRGYLATKSGLLALTSGNTNFGFFVSKAEFESAVANLGFIGVFPSQGTLDVYKALPTSQYVGYTLLVFYDTNGKASEIYMLNTKLP